MVSRDKAQPSVGLGGMLEDLAPSGGVTYGGGGKRWIFVCSWSTDSDWRRTVNYVLPDAQTRLQCCFFQSLSGNP